MALPPPTATIPSPAWTATSATCSDGTSVQRPAVRTPSPRSAQRSLARRSGCVMPSSPSVSGNCARPQRTITPARRSPSARSRWQVLPRIGDEALRGTGLAAAARACEEDLAHRVEATHTRRRNAARCEVGLDREARDEGDTVTREHGAPRRLLEPELELDVQIAEARS